MSDQLSIGMMSGTSVDGAVDAAAIFTDGDSRVRRELVSEFRYETNDGARPIHHFTKAAEVAFRLAKGNLNDARVEYPAALKHYLSQTFQISDRHEIDKKLATLNYEFSKSTDSLTGLDEVIEKSTDVHILAAKQILEELGPLASKVSCIGYHGQTLYHAPFDHVTVQVGNAQRLSNELKLPVVFDFRSNDVAQGGQGAPLAPIYHWALLKNAGLTRAAILNLGGTANVTVIDGTCDQMLGFDTGPANGLLDRYVKEKAGLALDQDSAFALQGTVSQLALDALTKSSILLPDGRNFLDIVPPKSLDIRDYTFNLPEFSSLSINDGCATLNAFTAECVARAIQFIEAAKFTLPTHWVLCGGGALNPHLRQQLKSRIESRTRSEITLLSADDIGWSAKGMEAELFAFLAVRSSRNLPLTFPGTTGVAQATTGGKIFLPQ